LAICNFYYLFIFGELMRIDDKQDYSDLWINLQVEVKLMHNYCLQGRWGDAENCARKCSQLSLDLADALKAMDEIPE
jgi:hypothetical protein